MMRYLLLTVVIFFLTFNITTTMAQQNDVTRTDLLDALMYLKVDLADIREEIIPAGQVVPKHLHHFPVLGYVVSGLVLFQIEGGEQMILKEGDAFYEPKDTTILHFDNVSKDEALTFVAFYLKEVEEENIMLPN